MTAAQRSFLMTMEMRRDGLQSIADNVRTALSSDAEAADEAIQAIAGAMSMFLASDVIYRVAGACRSSTTQLQEDDIGNQTAAGLAVPARAASGSIRRRSPTRSASSSRAAAATATAASRRPACTARSSTP